jgi:hypothetical protein
MKLPYVEEAEHDECYAEAAADGGADSGGAPQAPLPGPEPGTQDPAAVQRKGRHHVEDDEDGVDDGEVGEDAGERRTGADQAASESDEVADDSDPDTGNGACYRHAELLHRACRLGLHLGDPAENEQRYSVDFEPVAPRHHGVRHLVQNDRDEETDGGDRPHQPVGRGRESRVGGGKEADGQGPGDQHREQHP